MRTFALCLLVLLLCSCGKIDWDLPGIDEPSSPAAGTIPWSEYESDFKDLDRAEQRLARFGLQFRWDGIAWEWDEDVRDKYLSHSDSSWEDQVEALKSYLKTLDRQIRKYGRPFHFATVSGHRMPANQDGSMTREYRAKRTLAEEMLSSLQIKAKLD